MRFFSATIAIGLTAGQTAASSGYQGWGSKASYSTPDNTDNQCTTEQSGGYDWTGLETGSFDSYGSNKFSSWNCSDSFGKRDILTKRSFQSKCITADLDNEPAIDCDGDDRMSIKQYEVSSDKDAEIECHYQMPDDSICKEVHSCKAGGSVIENTQCGGAKKVTFKPHKESKGKRYHIGVHKIDFDCNSASVPSYSATSTAASSSVQPPAYTPSSSSSVESPSPSASEYASSMDPASSSGSLSSTEVSPGTPASVPAYSALSSSSSSMLPGYGDSSTLILSTSPSSSTEMSPQPTLYIPQPESPDVLPECLNSWMWTTSCKGNDDYDCFCKVPEFMEKVYGCISAWSESDDTNSGAGYLIGICARYIPENPAIITACPSTITPATGYTVPSSTASSPASSGKTVTQYSTIIATITSCGSEVKECPAGSATIQTSTQPMTTTVESKAIAPAGVPCTTITYSSTIVSPVTYSTGESQGSPIPSSSYTTSIITTVTVPQVQITTYTVTESGSTHETPGLGYETLPPVAPSSPTQPSSAESPPAPYPTSSVGSPVGGSAKPSGFGTSYAEPSHTLTPYTGAGAAKDCRIPVTLIFLVASALFVSQVLGWC